MLEGESLQETMNLLITMNPINLAEKSKHERLSTEIQARRQYDKNVRNKREKGERKRKRGLGGGQSWEIEGGR